MWASRHACFAYPFFVVASSTELIPTSITAAPGLIQSALTISALPAAQTTMSASLTFFTPRRNTTIPKTQKAMHGEARGRVLYRGKGSKACKKNS